MNLEKFIGKVCAFYTKPNVVTSGLPTPGATRYVGTVISAKPLPPIPRGNIPNAELTVRGKSGKTAAVNLVEQHAQLFDTWNEALENART